MIFPPLSRAKLMRWHFFTAWSWKLVKSLLNNAARWRIAFCGKCSSEVRCCWWPSCKKRWLPRRLITINLVALINIPHDRKRQSKGDDSSWWVMIFSWWKMELICKLLWSDFFRRDCFIPPITRNHLLCQSLCPINGQIFSPIIERNPFFNIFPANFHT